MKGTNILCIQNKELSNVKTGGTYSNHCALKGLETLYYYALEVYNKGHLRAKFTN